MAIHAHDEHDVHGKLVGHIIGVCGVGAAVALIGVSAAMNWRFGYSLGKTPLDGVIYGTASAAADCLKAVVPFYLFGAIRRRIWSRAIAAAIVGIVVTGYSLFSAFGHAAQNRSETTGNRTFDAKLYKSLSADLTRAQEQRSWVPPHRPIATVSSDIDGIKVQRQWLLTQECVVINTKVGRDFCTKYHELGAELGTGRQAEELEARIADIQRKLAGYQGTAAEQEADPQAAVLAAFLGISVQTVQLVLMVFVAVLLEVGSGLGLYMALGHWRGERASQDKLSREPATDTLAELAVETLPPRKALSVNATQTADVDEDVQKFCDDRIRPSPGCARSVTETYDAYQQWCEERKVDPLSLPMFVRVLGDLGFHRVRSGDGLALEDVELTGSVQSRARK